MGKGAVGEEVKLKATINRWIQAVGSHLKVTRCENTGKQEEKDELFTIAARKAHGTERQVLSDFYGSLTKRTGSVQAVDSLPLRPHRCPLKSSSRPPLPSHPHALSAGPHPARPPATEQKILSEPSAPDSPPFRKSVRRRTRRRKGRETGKPQLNCSPAGRVACCRGRGRPGSKHGAERRRRQPIQRENGRSQEGCEERRRGGEEKVG